MEQLGYGLIAMACYGHLWANQQRISLKLKDIQLSILLKNTVHCRMLN